MPQAQVCERSKSVESSGKPDAWKLARPVWGWGRGVTPRPTPLVEESNLASQGYLEDDLGRPKVQATADLCRQINHSLEVHEVNDRFRRSLAIGDVLFCAVDSIETRRLIWEAVKGKIGFYADGRMSAEVLRILTACDSAGRDHYPSTLFSADEAYADPCTAKTTIYCANIAAGIMIAQFTRYLRNLPVDCDIQLNLLASELHVPSGVTS
jgi:hypothetical protein